ncbi:MAG: MFS transporter [Bacteroidaceae bacterium]
MKQTKRNPWAWIPTLYFAEGIPYVVVMTISVMMYKRLGLSNTDIAIYTSWLYLPWVIKPFWSPLVDILKTKRWWIVTMQMLIGAALGGVAFTLNVPNNVQWTLAFFWLMAFSSATHDIAADGFYMLALNKHDQNFYVGIRSTFYRIATIAGQGALIMMAGALEVYTRKVAYAWSLTFYGTAAFFIAITIYHSFILPSPKVDRAVTTHHNPKFLFLDFLNTFITFFRKPQALIAIVFMLFYRFPEALLAKISFLFLVDPQKDGGLGLSTSEIGFAQGTVGIIGLTAGGIIGGIVASKGGLRKWLWPMVWSITLPDIVYVYMSYFQPESFGVICGCIFIEQFGYGFGFTAYMLFLIYYSQGNNKTAHYAICTAFMALSMMIPGMLAGWLQESVGYLNFFLIVMACCLITIGVSSLVNVEKYASEKQDLEENENDQ